MHLDKDFTTVLVVRVKYFLSSRQRQRVRVSVTCKKRKQIEAPDVLTY